MGKRIKYALKEDGFVELKIFDILGREVRSLVNDNQSAGYKSIIWNGDNNEGQSISSGVYFYKLKVNDFVSTKKLVLIK